MKILFSVILLLNLVRNDVKKVNKEILELEKEKIEMQYGKKIIAKARKILQKKQKDYFNKSDLTDLYLKLFGSSDASEMEKIEKIKQKGDNLTEDNKKKLKTKSDIERFLKSKNQLHYTLNNVLKSLERRDYANFLEEQNEDESIQNFILDEKDRNLLDGNANSYYNYY